MPSGRKWNRIAGGSSRTPAAAARTTVVLSKRCCGLREPAAPGATCHLCLGRWNIVSKRCRDWVKADVFKRLFDAVRDEPDMEYAMVEATIVKGLPRRKPGWRR